jgi:hypothetical protein
VRYGFACKVNRIGRSDEICRRLCAMKIPKRFGIIRARVQFQSRHLSTHGCSINHWVVSIKSRRMHVYQNSRDRWNSSEFWRRVLNSENCHVLYHRESPSIIEKSLLFLESSVFSQRPPSFRYNTVFSKFLFSKTIIILS